jgi:hypothetical protein
MAETPTFWRDVAVKGSATDYKEKYVVSLSNAGNLELTHEGQPVPLGTINERAESIAVQKYTKGVGITYEMIRDDNIGAFTDIVSLFGRSAARVPDILIVQLLAANSGAGPTMSDGNPLFHASHNNIGSTAALSYTSARAAQKQMRKQTGFGPDAPPIAVEPSVMLVPVELSDIADDLFTQEYVPGASQPTSQRNSLRGRLRPAYSPRLDAISETRWWLFAEPADIPTFRCDFLDGNESAEAHMVPQKTLTEISYEFYLWGVGATALNYEGAITNAGTT